MDLQQKMFKLVEDWKLSNLTKGEFSSQHKVTYHSFNYWIKKYYRTNKIVKVVKPPINRTFLNLFTQRYKKVFIFAMQGTNNGEF